MWALALIRLDKHMTPWETGYVAASNAIANGTLETKLNDIGNHEGSMSEVYGGAVSCLLTCYRALLAAGFTVESDDPEIDAFLKSDPASQIISIKRFLSVGDGKKLSAMVGIVHGCRMFIGFKAPQPAPAENPRPTMTASLFTAFGFAHDARSLSSLLADPRTPSAYRLYSRSRVNSLLSRAISPSRSAIRAINKGSPPCLATAARTSTAS
jgi:hypothetical protein